MDWLLEVTPAATMSTLDSVAWLYVVTNTVRVLFYAPQIRAVWKAQDGAEALSITTWAFWTFAHITAVLYGWLVIHDNAFCAIFMANTVCAATVTLMAMTKRFSKHTSRDELRADGMSPA